MITLYSWRGWPLPSLQGTVQEGGVLSQTGVTVLPWDRLFKGDGGIDVSAIQHETFRGAGPELLAGG